MTVRTLPGRRPGVLGTVQERVREAPGGTLLALGLPVLFLHVENQPGFNLQLGSAGAHVALSDLVVVALAAAAVAVGLRDGFAGIRCGRAVWVAAGGLLAMVGLGTLLGAREDGYRLATHAVTAAKFAEYALLAVAAALLVRSRRDVEVALAGFAVWAAAATVLALGQFLGADVVDAWPAGRRQPSFLGHHDFAALSGAALSLGLAALALGRAWPFARTTALAAGVAGGLGLILSGSSAGAIGVVAAAVIVIAVSRRRGTLELRRLGSVIAATVVVVGGVLVLRGQDFDQFLRFLGVRTEQRTTREDVQSYGQRTVLVYIGWRIFRDAPVLGAGWQASSEVETYGPHLAEARRRFPGTAPKAFPSPEHPYGIQNAYVQALAELGLVGAALFVGLLLTGLATAARIALRAPPPAAATALVALVWLLVAAAVWSANGLVAGIPLDALEWLALGLAVAAVRGAHAWG